MRFFVVLGVAVLFTLASARHSDDHDHDDDHDDHNHHKIAPYNFHFAFPLFRQVARDHPSGNLVISTISISTAFAFLALGARTQTRSQILEGFGFNLSEISEEEIHEGFHRLLDLQDDKYRKLQLTGGNALFISNQHKILQSFLVEAKRLYHSGAFSTDFKDIKEATKQISSYIEKSTHGKVTELLDIVDQDTISVLINYFFFRGIWEHPFDEKLTHEGDFHVNESTTVTVPFMTRTGMFKVVVKEEATVVTIPYKDHITALFIMPKEGTLTAMEQTLTYELSMKWKKMMRMQFVELSLPKFSVSTTIDLKQILSKFGVNDVFSDEADLSGITENTDTKISQAVHVAGITVEERGRDDSDSSSHEAVAADAAAVPVIRFDRPFLLAVHDYKARCNLIASRIVNPLV